MSKKTAKTADAVALLNRHFGDGPERRAEIDQIKQDLAIGEQIHHARKAAGLTQKQLADRVGTTQSVISDLESAEYQGHSMPMLRRIAEALGMSVRVSFVEQKIPEHA